MQTKVINLYGAPGVGKSTLACELFAKMKSRGIAVELVREIAKNWAWENTPPTIFDQFYFLGKQSHLESNLYNKVEYIITDSPVLLASFYMEYYFSNQKFTQPALDFYDVARDNGVVHKNFFLEPNNNVYSLYGRFQPENEVSKIDKKQKEFLDRLNVKYDVVSEKDKAEYIMRSLL